MATGRDWLAANKLVHNITLSPTHFAKDFLATPMLHETKS